MRTKKQLIGVGSIIALLVLITLAQTVLLPMFFGVFIGSIRVSLTTWLHRKTKLTYPFRAGVVIACVLLLFVGLFVVPGALIDGGTLRSYLVSSRESIYTALAQRLPDILPESVSSAVMGGTSRVISGLMNATTFGTQVLLTLFYSFAFLIGYPHLIEKFGGKLQLSEVTFPSREDIRRKSINYLGGLTKMVIILTVLYAIVMYALAVPEALFIAFGAAFLTYIPTVGTFFGIVGAALVTYVLTDDITTTMLVFLGLELIQVIDQYYITPHVVGRAVQINVVASVFFITIFGWMRGLGGVFLALWLGSLLVETLKLNNAEQRYIDLLT